MSHADRNDRLMHSQPLWRSNSRWLKASSLWKFNHPMWISFLLEHTVRLMKHWVVMSEKKIQCQPKGAVASFILHYTSCFYSSSLRVSLMHKQTAAISLSVCLWFFNSMLTFLRTHTFSSSSLCLYPLARHTAHSRYLKKYLLHWTKAGAMVVSQGLQMSVSCHQSIS